MLRALLTAIANRVGQWHAGARAAVDVTTVVQRQTLLIRAVGGHCTVTTLVPAVSPVTDMLIVRVPYNYIRY